MRKTIVLGAILIGLQIPLLAYVFLQERTWGGLERDGALGVAAAGDSSVYVTGSTRSFGAGADDAFLLKYSASGALLWQRTYGTAADDLNSGAEAGIAVAVAPDGSGVVMLGNYRDGNIFLAKFDPNGALMWQRTWGTTDPDVFESASAIAISSTTGTIYVTGNISAPDDAFLLSFTAGGTLIWQRTWGGASFDTARGVAVATDGGIYITGETVFTANAAFLVKFAENGSVLWEREWGVIGKAGAPTEDDDTNGNSVAAAPDGGAYVVGDTTGTGFAAGNLVAVRFDANGNFVWQRIGGPGFGFAADVAVGPDGNVHVAGNVFTDGGDSGANAFVWTLLANGRGNDAGIWGGDDLGELERATSVAVAPDGTIVAVGAAGEPPYVFDRGSKNAKAVNTFLNIIAGNVAAAAGVTGTPAPVVATPVGSETFAGAPDAFLIRVRQ